MKEKLGEERERGIKTREKKVCRKRKGKFNHNQRREGWWWVPCKRKKYNLSDRQGLLFASSYYCFYLHLLFQSLSFKGSQLPSSCCCSFLSLSRNSMSCLIDRSDHMPGLYLDSFSYPSSLVLLLLVLISSSDNHSFNGSFSSLSLHNNNDGCQEEGGGGGFS